MPPQIPTRLPPPTAANRQEMLVAASRDGMVSTVRGLVAAGADVNGPNTMQWTALMWAARLGRVSLCQTLIRLGADVNQRTQMQECPLVQALAHNERKAACVLLEAGADVNARGMGRQTVLMMAINRDDVVLVRDLLRRGARVNERDANAETALMHVMMRPHLEKGPEMVRILLSAGADWRMTTLCTGRTAEQMEPLGQRVSDEGRALLRAVRERDTLCTAAAQECAASEAPPIGARQAPAPGRRM